MHDHDFDALWDLAQTEPPQKFYCDDIIGLPAPAQQYLRHAIAEGAPLYTAVRLHMHGEIRLEDQWRPFSAQQVIRWNRGFVWRARVSQNGLPIWGSDRFVDGTGDMRWKLLGLATVAAAHGPDVSRSALGRVQVESVWLPTALVGHDVHWQAKDPTHLGVDLEVAHAAAHLDMSLEHDGRLSRVKMLRWGNPEHGEFHEVPFGAIATEERMFDGITIPTTLKVGWYFDTPRFEEDGEFFRVTVDHAEFR
jgi:hypothetical protein